VTISRTKKKFEEKNIKNIMSGLVLFESVVFCRFENLEEEMMFLKIWISMFFGSRR
jgi:hypothetical protein